MPSTRGGWEGYKGELLLKCTSFTGPHVVPLLPPYPWERGSLSFNCSPQVHLLLLLRRLRLGGDPPCSPRSVLGMPDSVPHRGIEERVQLPKSISVRSSGYLKLNLASGSSGSSSSNGRVRVSASIDVGSPRVFPAAVEVKGSSPAAVTGEGLEFEVYNQGMFKTELAGEQCPYIHCCHFHHALTSSSYRFLPYPN